jgi:hypothetical protein
MDNTTQSDPAGESTEKAMGEGGSKTFPPGGRSNTTSTGLDIEKLEALNREEALSVASERLAATLVLYQNLGGQVTAVTLPEGKEIFNRRDVILLPAVRDDSSGTYSLYVPEPYQNAPGGV